MGGDKTQHTFDYEATGFNPRPHMGGDAFVLENNAWVRVFQSTPPHGGRLFAEKCPSRRERFNPRPHMGGDKIGCHNGFSVDVSIHAPTWGATRYSEPDAFGSMFQSTPPHGGRQEERGVRLFEVWFQSTPPHGGRLCLLQHFVL